MALINKLTAVADAIRSKTGKAEGMTLDQMPLEIEGIVAGGGGLPSGIKGVYYAEITPAEDTNAIRINHNLDGNVIIALLWADDFTIDPEVIEGQIPLGQGYIATNLEVLLGTSTTTQQFIFYSTYISTNKAINRMGGYTSDAYAPRVIDDNNFGFYTANTTVGKFKAGQTLQVLIIAKEG